MRGISRARWVSENVRAKEVRLALVGYQLRQTARRLPQGRLGIRAPLPASWPDRACAHPEQRKRELKRRTAPRALPAAAIARATSPEFPVFQKSRYFSVPPHWREIATTSQGPAFSALHPPPA